MRRGAVAYCTPRIEYLIRPSHARSGTLLAPEPKAVGHFNAGSRPVTTTKMKSPLLIGIVLLTAASILFSVVAGAQTPWTVVVAPTMNPLPAGVCAAVKLSFTDAAGAVPRNSDGSRILQSDFDLVVTASNPASVAGMYSGSNNWSACVCQGAPAGSVATITATYPSQGLAESMRVGRVTAKASATFVTSKPQGPLNPPGCQSAALRTIAETRPLSVPVSSITTRVIAKGSAVVAPPPPLNSAGGAPTTNATSSPVPISVGDTKVPLPAPLPAVGGVSSPQVTATGVKIPLAPPAPSVIDPTNPSGFSAVQTGAGEVQLSWEPVRYTSYYVLFGPGLPQGGARIGAQNGGLAGGGSEVTTGGVSIVATATGVPAGSQEWAVGSYFDPDGVSTAAADFPRVTLNVKLTLPINPSGFSALQTATGVVRLSWQPVSGVSYYKLYGAGLPDGGVKVAAVNTVSSSNVDSASIAYTATAVPAGLRLWRVGSFLDPGAVSTDSATFPAVSLNVTAAVLANPSGFTAAETAPGIVRLSWQPVTGASYYMLYGAGLPNGGLRIGLGGGISGSTGVVPVSVGYTVTPPAGLQLWQVGSFFDPGGISTDRFEFPKATLTVTKPVPINPSGFTAVPLGPGQVRFSWQPVSGASYYLLIGTGLPQEGVTVGLGGGLSGSTGTFESVGFTATRLPAGAGTWQVGSYFEPGPVRTPWEDFPRIVAVVKPPTNPSAFKGVSVGPGQVDFSWQPVNEASYYVLTGTGLPVGGVKVFAVGASSSTGAFVYAGYNATGLPPGAGTWQVGSYFDPGAFSTPSQDFPGIITIVKPPINPSGFTATQTSPGVVRLKWDPVKGASYYVLLGPGLPQGGVKVGPGAAGASGDTGTFEWVEFSAIGVPSGPQEWAVASYYDPGPLSTPAAEFPRVSLNVAPPINPSLFAAEQVGSGQVRFSWLPVSGASYYILTGSGLTKSGIKVGPASSGASGPTGTFQWVEVTASGIPPGLGSWQVGSYFEPGSISTPVTAFPAVTLTVILKSP